MSSVDVPSYICPRLHAAPLNATDGLQVNACSLCNMLVKLCATCRGITARRICDYLRQVRDSLSASKLSDYKAHRRRRTDI